MSKQFGTDRRPDLDDPWRRLTLAILAAAALAGTVLLAWQHYGFAR